MRTTVNIDDHLLAEAKVLAARQHRSLGEVIDDALRTSLTGKTTARKAPTFTVVGDPDVPPKIDLLDKEIMADVLGWNDRIGL